MSWRRGEDTAVTVLHGPASAPETAPPPTPPPERPVGLWRKLAIVGILLALVVGLVWQVTRSDTGGEDLATPTTSATTAAAAPAASVLVDPPELRNTGEDFDAVVRSLDAFTRWAFQHPDPKWTPFVMHPACDCFKEMEARLTALQTSGQRFGSEGEQVRKVIVRDRLDPNQVTVYVVFSGRTAGVVDAAGTVVQAPEDLPPTGINLELRRGDDGRWRTVQEIFLGTPGEGWEQW